MLTLEEYASSVSKGNACKIYTSPRFGVTYDNMLFQSNEDLCSVFGVTEDRLSTMQRCKTDIGMMFKLCNLWNECKDSQQFNVSLGEYCHWMGVTTDSAHPVYASYKPSVVLICNGNVLKSNRELCELLSIPSHVLYRYYRKCTPLKQIVDEYYVKKEKKVYFTEKVPFDTVLSLDSMLKMDKEELASKVLGKTVFEFEELPSSNVADYVTVCINLDMVSGLRYEQVMKVMVSIKSQIYRMTLHRLSLTRRFMEYNTPIGDWKIDNCTVTRDKRIIIKVSRKDKLCCSG